MLEQILKRWYLYIVTNNVSQTMVSSVIIVRPGQPAIKEESRRQGETDVPGPSGVREGGKIIWLV